MAAASTTLKELSIKLFNADAVKFGNFTTQSGAVTPAYFDLRVTISYPSLMKELSDLLSQIVNEVVEEIQKGDPTEKKILICGIPYAAVPITSLVSVNMNLPMIMKRKAAKNYGTIKMIEGIWNSGDTCILVDDVIMFGNSIIETVDELNSLGLRCSQVVIILDRQQGAVEKLNKCGIKVRALLTLSKIMGYLLEDNLITSESCKMVMDYLDANQVSDVSQYYSCNSENSSNEIK